MLIFLKCKLTFYQSLPQLPALPRFGAFFCTVCLFFLDFFSDEGIGSESCFHILDSVHFSQFRVVPSILRGEGSLLGFSFPPPDRGNSWHRSGSPSFRTWIFRPFVFCSPTFSLILGKRFLWTSPAPGLDVSTPM